MATFPMLVGQLHVPSSWLHVRNVAEADLAADDEDGLVVCFLACPLDPLVGGQPTFRILCFRTTTYASLDDIQGAAEDQAVAEIVAVPLTPREDGFLSPVDIETLRIVTDYRDHLTKWPQHKWWGGADGIEDELTPCESHSANCKCNLPAIQACAPCCAMEHIHRWQARCCGVACRTLRIASCDAILRAYSDADGDADGDVDGDVDGAARTDVDRPRYVASLRIYLEAGAFDLDRRLCVSWNRTAGCASAGIEPQAVRQLQSNRRPCVSWNRTAGHVSAGIEPQAMRQLESNRRPCVCHRVRHRHVACLA